MSTLLRSQIVTGCCDAVITSLHRHDFHTCPCGRTSIDGGRDYLRVVGNYGPGTPASIQVEEDLNQDQARAVIATYIAIYKAFEDGRKNRGVPLSVVGRYQPEWFTTEDAKHAGYTMWQVLDLLERNEIISRFWRTHNGHHRYLRFEPRKPLEIRD